MPTNIGSFLDTSSLQKKQRLAKSLYHINNFLLSKTVTKTTYNLTCISTTLYIGVCG